MLRLLTYNIQLGRNLPHIYGWLKSLKHIPDIICLQEFPQGKKSTAARQKFFTNQAIFFSEGLVKSKRVYGQLTIINTSLLSPQSQKILYFEENYIDRTYQDNKRSAHIIECRVDEKTLAIVNLHLTPFSLHINKRRQLLQIIRTLNTKHAIITGDFNYTSLFASKGLTKFMATHKFSLAGKQLVTHRLTYLIPHQLDYVFYKGFRVTSAVVLPMLYSDHFPVLVEFEIK